MKCRNSLGTKGISAKLPELIFASHLKPAAWHYLTPVPMGLLGADAEHHVPVCQVISSRSFPTPSSAAPASRRAPKSTRSAQEHCGCSGFAPWAEKQLPATAGGETQTILSKTKRFHATKVAELLPAPACVEGMFMIQQRMFSPIFFYSFILSFC